MPERTTLLEAQRGFVAAVRRSANLHQALPLLVGDVVRNEELLAIYRGNAVANASKALSLAYPVIEKIVGGEFFAGLCRAFWAERPSQSGDLNDYGGDFADFLAQFPHVAELPYLPDVARIEWLVATSLHAADHTAATLAQLADVKPEALAALRFSLQPGLGLQRSVWPVATIWQQHQSTYEGEINVDMDDAECMVVHRLGLRAEITILDGAELALWRSAQAGQTLACMLEAAFAEDEAFDVQGALARGFAGEFVTALHA